MASSPAFSVVSFSSVNTELPVTRLNLQSLNPRRQCRGICDLRGRNCRTSRNAVSASVSFPVQGGLLRRRRSAGLMNLRLPFSPRAEFWVRFERHGRREFKFLSFTEAREGVVLPAAERTALEMLHLKDLKAQNYLFQSIDKNIIKTMTHKRRKFGLL
ncbi:hypothetical protein E3N88_18990 [Mikania micrantha]|uniref:Uncharacterized protein n=1 Tax=Mikania micrantha TaxID=192012 RepID=A0A5N6NMG7_9ASTR|nr:hypothetical protein E3N88_18990 [Mikania micrantha]